uniref:protein-tyrosine-phosphatase n=1 Tax=Equus caballus TaxID=9796 RepID=A0A5F5PVV3_HORSE
IWYRQQRPEVRLVSYLLCSSSSHPISISGLVCGLREFTSVWGGPLSPGQSGTEERDLKHYWFTSWPDQKTPDRAPPLLHLVREVEEAAQQEGPHGAPIVVHCSAGIGRTGCFIATSICCQQLRQEGVVDILKTTCQLRQDRGGMIQTCEQYQFVHHVMSLYEKQLSRQGPE